MIVLRPPGQNCEVIMLINTMWMWIMCGESIKYVYSHLI